MTIQSQYDGKCKGFTQNDGSLVIHQWKVGDQIFYQKEPKCICISQGCFEAQQKATGGQVPRQSTLPTNVMSTEDKVKNANVILQTLWEMGMSKAIQVIPEVTNVPPTGTLSPELTRQIEDNNEGRLSLAKTFFKGLCFSWGR